jgi:sec-independent protein translocase protein TatA
MIGLGAPELLLIMGIVIIIFGAGKLPEVGAAMGKSIREFRSATEEATNKYTAKDTAV